MLADETRVTVGLMVRRSPLVWSVIVCVVAACGGGKGGPAARAPGGDTVAPPPAPAVPATPAMAAGKPKADLIPRAVLFGNPERAAPEISPDGKHLAFLAPADGVMNVFVAPADDLTQAVAVTHEASRPVREYSWSLDSKWILFAQDLAGDENFHLWRVGLDGQPPVDLTPAPGARAEVIGTSVKKPGTILIGLNDRDPRWHDVHQLDLASGKRTLVVKNEGFSGFVVDEDLKLRFARRQDPDGRTIYLTPSKGYAKWTPAFTIGFEDASTTEVLGFESTGKRYYLVDSRGRDRAGLFEVDAATKKATLLAEHPKVDAEGMVIRQPRTAKVRAIAFNPARIEWTVLDPAIGKDLQALRALDEGDLSVISMTLADDVWIVQFASDRASARYWRWDRKAQQGTFLFAARPALADLPLARTTPVMVPTRDGLEMVSYLSLPPAADPDGDGRPTAPIAMVLLVHGGPWARDTWRFNPIVQLLANRGYAVLQVNFRGSTGFGKAFLNAGNKQWGKQMHDDLIDAVTWASERDVTAADTVCIMGGSYGGYATLAGLTLTPKAFRCGVDIVGPSSIPTLLASIPPYWAPFIAEFKLRVGDWTDPAVKAALLDVSPLTHAARIERPLLIAQGANDPRVKQAESDQIVAAMQDKGLPVTYVLFPDEGHGFARPENNLAFTALTEAFLSAHLGGWYQPMTPADFAGSTLQILAGRDGIPGLPAEVGKPSAN